MKKNVLKVTVSFEREKGSVQKIKGCMPIRIKIQNETMKEVVKKKEYMEGQIESLDKMMNWAIREIV